MPWQAAPSKLVADTYTYRMLHAPPIVWSPASSTASMFSDCNLGLAPLAKVIHDKVFVLYPTLVVSIMTVVVRYLGRFDDYHPFLHGDPKDC